MPAVRRPPLRVWVWTAVTVALVVVAALLWRGSDAAATTHTTAGTTRAPAGEPAGTLTQRWSAAGNPLPDPVVSRSRVLLGSAHGVRALDPATGQEAWHYTRSNASLCGVTATDGIVVTVFRTADRCDEAVGLRADTGVYAWTRNIDLRADATLTSAPQVVLAVSPTGLHALDPIGDQDRWRIREPADCQILSARPGTDGVAVVERCGAKAALQLKLLDLFSGNPRWTRDLPGAAADTTPLVLGADRVAAVATGDALRLFAPADGAEIATVAASGPVSSAAATQVGDVTLVWQGGALTAVDVGTRTQLWQKPARGLPAAATEGSQALAAGGGVLVPEEGAFVRRDVRTGEELGRSTVADLPEGGVATPLGPTVVYRLADRVIGYR